MGRRLEEYLAALPHALDSFADCRAKGSLIRTSFAVRPLSRLAALPAVLASHVRSPPLASQWVPEVHYIALSLATADEHAMDARAFTSFWRDVMLALTDGTYSSLLGWLHPETLLRGVSSRWSYFHEGSALTARKHSHGLRLELDVPDGLFHELVLDGYTGVIQALIDRSRRPEARASRVLTSVRAGRTLAQYDLSGW
jgi:hypothetical protein